MARRAGKDQGWIGAVIVGGMIVFAVTFLKPNRTTSPPAANEVPADAQPVVDERFTSDPVVRRLDDNEGAEWLRRVTTTYQTAPAYRDRTLMRLVAADDPTRLLDQAEMLVEFERPNRLRIDIHRDRDQLLIVSDGRQMFTRIIDPATNNFDNQLVVKEAPQKLTVQSLYEACEYLRPDQPDERFSALMSLPAPLLVSQVALLFDPRAMLDLLNQATEVELLPEDRFRGLPSQPVQVTTPGGTFTFWIDPVALVLQKIQFPSAPTVNEADAARPQLVLTAEFRDRRFDRFQGDASFELPISQATQPVRSFVLPPPTEAVGLLGRNVSGYWFTDLYGDRQDDGDWQGRVAVLVWFANHPASRAVLHEVQETANHFDGNPRVDFRAICVEPTTSVSHQQVDQMLKAWSIRLPAVRDLEAFGRDVFRVNQAPTLVVLDEQGRVQLVEVGGNAELDRQLATVLDRLLAGENLAQQYLDHQQQQRQKYEQLLSTVRLPADSLQLPRLSFSPN